MAKQYEIYITKSSEVAERIAKSFKSDVEGKHGWNIVNGCTDSFGKDYNIPQCYCSKDNYYAALILDNVEKESYKLTIC